ncbi:hypothetical protein BpHYR1_029372 [Brachionus plicatilis]|uniref:Uncharacterized protein n=1 Tax=Brachionus plicatilis TaxID=10195 RepID=A0A3M7PAB4_BRAPC|nr:hypothetical protein BpHYR1_029372 [Brachionus plicatilis]
MSLCDVFLNELLCLSGLGSSRPNMSRHSALLLLTRRAKILLGIYFLVVLFQKAELAQFGEQFFGILTVGLEVARQIVAGIASLVKIVEQGVSVSALAYAEQYFSFDAGLQRFEQDVGPVERDQVGAQQELGQDGGHRAEYVGSVQCAVFGIAANSGYEVDTAVSDPKGRVAEKRRHVIFQKVVDLLLVQQADLGHFGQA